MAKNKDYVSVPRDEYEELVECKTKVNLLIDYVIGMEKTDIFKSGTATNFYEADAVNNILGCGYINSYIDSFKREYEEKKARKKKCK